MYVYVYGSPNVSKYAHVCVYIYDGPYVSICLCVFMCMIVLM